MTLYEKIKAMSIEEMVAFFENFNEQDVADESCRLCQEEHDGMCFMDMCGRADCLYDSKETIKRWLTQELEPKTKKHFTPEEVRKMSRAEVKANYSRIIESMKLWS